MLATFDYLAPGTLADAVAALAATPGSQPLAGGQGLLPAMNDGREAPPLLVDLRQIGALQGIEEAGGGGLRIGALTTLDTLLDHPALNGRHTALIEAARASGDPQLRNRATIGGCLADPRVAADLAAPLLAAEAMLTLAGAAGERVVSADELYRADPAVAAGEIITLVQLPDIPAGAGSAYEKLADFATGEPICGVAVIAARRRNGTLERVRVAVTGAARRPTRLVEAEQALTGRKAPVDTSELPVGPADGYLGDARASAGYRAHLTRVLAGRAAGRAIARWRT
jgi:carbon-monoxide dehydrogenase medium subunit